MALSDATKEALYLRNFCSSLAIPQLPQTELYTDNQGAIVLTKPNAGHHSRTKHIDVRHHFVRQQTVVVYRYVNTNENPADALTKPLGTIAHKRATELLKIEAAC